MPAVTFEVAAGTPGPMFDISTVDGSCSRRARAVVVSGGVVGVLPLTHALFILRGSLSLLG